MTVILFKETSNKPTVAHITFDSKEVKKRYWDILRAGRPFPHKP